MPNAFTEIPAPPAPLSPPRKRWTRAECAAIETLGIWDHEQLELVEGELISKMPKNRPHSIALAVVIHWLVQVFGWQFVQQGVPIDVRPEDNPTNEPQPD